MSSANPKQQPMLLAIVGPTAVGKSRLALELAQLLPGEIVSADSRQVYRYLDIGTAKPTPQERAIIPHHLIDIVDPDEEFNVALYQEMALKAIAGVQREGKTPILVGGSGLYVRAVTEGLTLPHIPPNLELRRTLEERGDQEGNGPLYQELQAVDPVAAGRIDPRNRRRIIRALEVWHETGIPFSALQRSEPPSYSMLTIGLTTERTHLYRLIDERVDHMLAQCLVEEVVGLTKRGYGFDLPAMSSLGYRQIGEYLRGEAELPNAIQRIKYETHRFARHQYAWFRLRDTKICWFDVKDDILAKTMRSIREAMAHEVS